VSEFDGRRYQARFDALAASGVDVHGEASMLEEARHQGPGLAFVEADLARFDLARTFDVVVLAGNVPLFCPVADRPGLVARCAAHVGVGGRMIAGFQLDGRYRLEDYDAGCAAAGLELEQRWAGWDGAPFDADAAAYAVSVHRRPATT